MVDYTEFGGEVGGGIWKLRRRREKRLEDERIGHCRILKGFLEESVQAEMYRHLADGENCREAGNKRNDRGEKTVKSGHGEVTLSRTTAPDSLILASSLKKKTD